VGYEEIDNGAVPSRSRYPKPLPISTARVSKRHLVRRSHFLHRVEVAQTLGFESLRTCSETEPSLKFNHSAR
jgi:hypothetical protein